MKSSKLGYCLLLFAGPFLISVGILFLIAHFFPSNSLVQDTGLGLPGLIVTFGIPIGLGCLLFTRAGMMECDHESVKITRFGKTSTVHWRDVKSVNQIPLGGTSPLYRLSFKTNINPVYFYLKGMNSNAYVKIWFLSWASDSSEFIKYARERIATFQS